MMFLSSNPVFKDNTVFHVLVKLCRILPKLSQFVNFHKTWLFTSFSCNFEKLLFFIKIDIVIIQQFVHKKIYRARSSQVNVVNYGLWHVVETLIKRRTKKRRQLVIIEACVHSVIFREHFFSELY